MPYTDQELVALYGSNSPPSTPAPATSHARKQTQATQSYPGTTTSVPSAEQSSAETLIWFVCVIGVSLYLGRLALRGRTRPASHSSLSDEAHYEAAVGEVAHGPRREGLWVKALAMCEGDEQRAKYCYIKLRVEQRVAEEASQRQEANERERSAITNANLKQLGFGLLVLSVGLAFTIVSYNAAVPGGSFVITTGAIFGGLFLTCKGLWNTVRAR